MKTNNQIKNRGAFSNPEGRFEKMTKEFYDDGWHHEVQEDEPLPFLKTEFIEDKTKKIISTNDSPDIGFDQSINPYKGCEHGCIYCYARPSHAYLNLSPGLDFETKIFYKPDAASLLENEINKKNYICKTIVIGANTDPYQPAESKFRITRQLLEIACQYHHPIAIITKNSLVTRDLDLLTYLADKNLVRVAITLTTLDISLKRILEPRTSSPQGRLRAMQTLSNAGVPITVMAAPMIPMVNDMELEHILEAAKQFGALNAGYTLIRLPYEVNQLFQEWLTQHYPDRAKHVMSLIRQMRGGKDYDSTFGKRMSGEGEFAFLLARRFKLACVRLGLNQKQSNALTTHLFKKQEKNKQFTLDL